MPLMPPKPLAFAYSHSCIDFHFSASARDFAVDEIPLYDFSGDGEHLVLKIRKKGLTTQQALSIIAAHFGLKIKEIGYAGLKDKNALTSQFISLPSSAQNALESFCHPQIKILEKTFHKNKIKIGHLRGNRFFMRLKKLSPQAATRAQEALKQIQKNGLPNYFGEQRFGKFNDNFILGRDLARGQTPKEHKIRSKKMRDFLISAYQSYLFNEYLSFRIQFSKIIESFLERDILGAVRLFLENYEIPNFCNPLNIEEILNQLNLEIISSLKEQNQLYKLAPGEICCHYPYGKNFTLLFKDLKEAAQRFQSLQIAPTALLCGKKAQKNSELAEILEKSFVDENICKADGTRRYAWIFAEKIEFSYNPQSAQGELHFSLPSGAYATNFLRELAHKEIDSME